MADAPAVRNAMGILSLLARSSAPLPAAAIVRELELPRATVYRVLGVLVELGFAVHLEREQRYGLGVAAFELGFAYAAQAPLAWVGRSALRRLVDVSGHNGHLAVLHGSDVLYLAEERHPDQPSLITDAGVRLPAQLTASGLALLAALPPRQLGALFPARHRFAQREGRGPRSLAELRGLLAQVRGQGFAVEDGVVTPGYASVACAVLDHGGRPAAALTLTFPAHRLDRRAREALAQQVRAAALEVSRALGGRTTAQGG